MAKIRISATIEDSIVDGPGLRYVVFTQGCPHHCYKCHNPKTWDLSGGYLISLSKIKKVLKKNKLIKGITLSGGEPLLQVKACLQLASFAKKNNLDVVLYTGYTYEEIISFNNKLIAKLLSNIDYLIDGPFIYENLDLNLLFRGSSNQRIIDVPKTLLANKIILAQIK